MGKWEDDKDGSISFGRVEFHKLMERYQYLGWDYM